MARDEYQARLTRWLSEREHWRRRYRQLGNARLATGVAAVAVAAASIGGNWISPWWLLVPALVFVALAIRHQRVDGSLQKATRAAAYYERALARVQDRWIGAGNSGERFRDPRHPYADDLDLFGRGSLFELISTARTGAGERTLADWLVAPGEREQVLARQAAVRELRDRLDLREDLALMGDEVRAAVDDRALKKWGERRPVHFFKGARIVAAVLAAAAVLTFALFLGQILAIRWFLLVILAETIFTFRARPAVMEAAAAAGTPARDLELAAGLLERIEKESFASPALARLRAALETQGVPASREIYRLRRLIDHLDSARNLFFAPIAAPLLWTAQFTMAVEAWRARCGSRMGAWIEAVGEFEALCSMASFAYERPQAVFPDLIETIDPQFEAVELVHPLLAPAEAVANDVALGGAGARLWIVSGSNMSGKSTLLRAVGVNTVLAWAGAPVTAGRLRVSRLRIGASMRALDSVTDHRSRFYAEITRLREIMDLARAGHALFLLDELLSGTNSHDRRIGAQALLEGLIHADAIGMATTHDLALAEIAAGIEGRAVNVHFEDHLEGGEIRFDFRLRPGVVARGNALELMRAVGLDV
jgi:MutS domain V